MKIKLLLACASLTALLPGTSSAVPTIYTYTGSPYSFIAFDTDPPAGSYTLDMRLSGMITLAAPINANTVFLFDSNTPGVSINFNDGRFDYTNNNLGADPSPGGAPGTFGGSLTTNASGEIEAWNFGILRFRPAADATHAIVNTVSDDVGGALGCGGGPCDDINLYGIGGDRVQSFVAGTWTVTAVPEPSTYAFMLAGLALVGLASRRSNRH